MPGARPGRLLPAVLGRRFAPAAALALIPILVMILAMVLALTASPLRAAEPADAGRATERTLGLVIDAAVIGAGGGVSAGGDYVVHATIGQIEADARHPAAGGSFIVVGGFWAMVRRPELPILDRMFRDRFEAEG